MLQESYADPIMNDGPRIHSIIPVSELTERVTQARALGQAIKLSPSGCEKPRTG